MSERTLPKDNLYGLEREALEARLSALGAPRFHGRQAFRWMYGFGAVDPNAWTDLPKSLRSEVAERFRVDPGGLDVERAADDGTVKYRFRPAGGGVVECVAMEQSGRTTLCLSSQAGCALGCEFCLTGKMGPGRNLDAGEIVGQVRLMRDARGLADERFNIVFMGMGEPLHHYDAVTSAIRVLTDPEGLAISRRRVTVSTVGLVPAIERLAEERVRPHLAVSLNATTDEVRDRLMPINRRYPLERLLGACRVWVERTGERPTFEYVLLAGINDHDDDVARLAAIARRIGAKINLIPFNAVPGLLPFEPPSEARVDALLAALLRAGHRASVRWSRGRSVRAACGQLALLEAS